MLDSREQHASSGPLCFESQFDIPQQSCILGQRGVFEDDHHLFYATTSGADLKEPLRNLGSRTSVDSPDFSVESGVREHPIIAKKLFRLCRQRQTQTEYRHTLEQHPNFTGLLNSHMLAD